MSIFTDRELEFVTSLRTNWTQLYLSEIVRLLRQDDKDAWKTDQRPQHSTGNQQSIAVK